MSENLTCPTLRDVLAAEMCYENYAGLGETVYVGRKSELASPMILNGVVYTAPTFKTGCGLYKIECAEETQGIIGSSLSSNKGFKLQLDFVIDKVDKETAEMSRALNNLKDLFFIVKDGSDFQIMYDPDRKCKVETDGIKGDTGKQASDERQTTCTYILQPVKFKNLYVDLTDESLAELMHDYVAPTPPDNSNSET